MSAPDHGDDDKGFLARWSQRKQEAKQPDQAAPDAGIAASPATGTDAPEEFDLSSLPKLEDLTSTTDITMFLRKGVPEHLRNAALRKSWALDPAIRNYVNPALDYAYDWNTPGGVPGSSELGAGMDVARLVSQIMRRVAMLSTQQKRIDSFGQDKSRGVDRLKRSAIAVMWMVGWMRRQSSAVALTFRSCRSAGQ